VLLHLDDRIRARMNRWRRWEFGWIRGTCVFSPLFFFSNNCFFLNFFRTWRNCKTRANGSFTFEKRGQTCKVKKRGTNAELSPKTRAALQLSLNIMIHSSPAYSRKK
jgi:hypothetical protein